MERPFNPSRLVAARQRAKLSKKQLAERAEVTHKSVALYEDGRQPSLGTLARLAQVLGVTAEFFFAPDLTLPTPENASFRSFSRMTSAQRDAALAAGGYAFEFSAWMERNFHLPAVAVPDLTGADPEAAAEIVRAEWGLGVLPIRNMIHLLESRGVRVFSLVEDSREVNAFSSWREGQTPFVFLNTVKSSESSRFDAAHELGHLVLHRHGEAKGKQVEAEANAFASALLMPKTEMLALASQCPSVVDVLRLKKRWNVSAMALVYRLHKVGVLTEWLYKSLCIELSSQGMRTREVDSAERETSLVFKKVFDAMKARGQGLREIAVDLRLPVEELHRLLFGLTSVSLGITNLAAQTTPPRRGHLRLVD
ncbi:XRE family transcriptional regulator [Lysobacter sp. MMG2]|uniref:XRE family transcriptional regulator n=1 Tax=Lysobacter sp. MMG2 TaxID=2801338 RepID=UPI001C22AC35|nr:XRE family transcriptional regulator [Lysobacter sp. MMG2]MBU8976898.1 XRE family transcriptional regulator [Lysobacter sp. MMG2]